MQMLYNSDNYAVVQFEVPTEPAPARAADTAVRPALAAPDMPAPPVPWMTRGGYEIVDKHARREIFIEGALAERFEAGVKELILTAPSEDDIDAFLEDYTALAQQPVHLH